jgi:hypothetical protein
MKTLPVSPVIATMGQFSQHETNQNLNLLLKGEVIVKTQSHEAWGGAVTAGMYLPAAREQIWQQLTNYARWVEYFPDLVRSEVVQASECTAQGYKRLYQAAEKAFLVFSAQVEIYLKVFEIGIDSACQQILFRLEKGSFLNFAADLTLQDWKGGTLLTYSVQATPLVPVPSIVLEQAMRFELPANMRVMRQVLQTS